MCVCEYMYPRLLPRKNNGHGQGLEPSRTVWAASGRNRDRGAAVGEDAIGEQQLKRTQSGAAAEADAVGEQQLKRTQSGSSS